MDISSMPFFRRLHLHIESYANWRENKIKNGGVTISWHGIRLAYIFAIINVDHTLVLVKRKGVLAKLFQYSMQKALIEYFCKEGCEVSGWNYIDTPYRD